MGGQSPALRTLPDHGYRQSHQQQDGGLNEAFGADFVFQSEEADDDRENGREYRSSR